jgi:hypothetical protein
MFENAREYARIQFWSLRKSVKIMFIVKIMWNVVKLCSNTAKQIVQICAQLLGDGNLKCCKTMHTAKIINEVPVSLPDSAARVQCLISLLETKID